MTTHLHLIPKLQLVIQMTNIHTIRDTFHACILITNFDALIIIYSQNTILLYMFRASSAHLQEYTVVHMQHMALSLSMRVPGGLSVHSLSEN